MLRPSQFRMATASETGITGMITERYFTGEHTEVTLLMTDGNSLHAHLREAPSSVVVGSIARLTTTGVGVMLPA